MGSVSPAPGECKLVLQLTVDQLRGDALMKLEPRFTGGFRYLIDHGLWYTNAQAVQKVAGCDLQGARLRPIEPTTLAPTIAAYLRQCPPSGRIGTPLEEVLKSQRCEQ